MKKMLRIIFFVLLLESFFFLKQTHLANAQQLPKQYLSVSPIINDLTLVPGKSLSYTLTIVNHADSPLGIHMEPSVFDPDNIASPTNSARSLVPWISLAEKDFIISEKETKQISVTVSPPKNILDGGYYGSILITPFVSGAQIPQSPIVLTRFVTVLFGTVGKINYDNLSGKVEITNFGADQIILNGNKSPQIKFGVKNNYFTHFTAKPSIIIHPLFSKSITISPEEKHVFPGRNRVWSETMSTPLNRIFYWTELSVSIGEGKQINVNTLFILIPFSYLVSGAILLFLILMVIFRNRTKKSLQVLLGNNKTLDKKKKI